MRMELPDRWSDVTFKRIEDGLPGSGTFADQTPNGVRRTALSRAYLRKYQTLTGDAERIKRWQGAECLYMIVTLATSDGDTLKLFRDSDVGDVDGDGAPEFLDAWGEPILFLHAAPGFSSVSQLQNGVLGLEESDVRHTPQDHDPLDIYRQAKQAIRTVPLIYSAGPDQDFDIFDGRLKDVQDPVYIGFDVLGKHYFFNYLLNNQDNVVRRLGRPEDVDGDSPEGWVDNIHNHEKGTSL